jgi:hypothetical protein
MIQNYVVRSSFEGMQMIYNSFLDTHKNVVRSSFEGMQMIYNSFLDSHKKVLDKSKKRRAQRDQVDR